MRSMYIFLNIKNSQLQVHNDTRILLNSNFLFIYRKITTVQLFVLFNEKFKERKEKQMVYI